MTHELWSALNRKVVDFLDSVALQDLVDQERMRQLAEATRQQQSTVKLIPGNNVSAMSS